MAKYRKLMYDAFYLMYDAFFKTLSFGAVLIKLVLNSSAFPAETRNTCRISERALAVEGCAGLGSTNRDGNDAYDLGMLLITWLGLDEVSRS